MVTGAVYLSFDRLKDMAAALRLNVKAKNIGDALDRITKAFQSGTMSSATPADKQTLVNGTIQFGFFFFFF